LITPIEAAVTTARIFPSAAQILTGEIAADTAIDSYAGISGPLNFGSAIFTFASSGSGDAVGVSNSGALVVPHGYLSDSALSDTATYDNQTFSSLGVTPGTYEWTWGSGTNQNFTLVIGEVPEPSTWAMMLAGFAGLGAMVLRRKRKVTPA
jgi:hypothetical protein